MGLNSYADAVEPIHDCPSPLFVNVGASGGSGGEGGIDRVFVGSSRHQLPPL
jgi:hypothetical protein